MQGGTVGGPETSAGTVDPGVPPAGTPVPAKCRRCGVAFPPEKPRCSQDGKDGPRHNFRPPNPDHVEREKRAAAAASMAVVRAHHEGVLRDAPMGSALWRDSFLALYGSYRVLEVVHRLTQGLLTCPSDVAVPRVARGGEPLNAAATTREVSHHFLFVQEPDGRWRTTWVAGHTLVPGATDERGGPVVLHAHLFSRQTLYRDLAAVRRAEVALGAPLGPVNEARVAALFATLTDAGSP